MVKILVSDKLSTEGVKILQAAGFTVDCKYNLAPDELKKIIGDYDGIIIRSETKLTADIIEHGDKLKVIGRAGVGLDNVDISAATKKGIMVMNTPAGNTIATCEQTFALLLSAARSTPFAHNSLKNKKWERSKFKGRELYAKTLGIVGLGRIGSEVAKRAVAFGMKILVYDPFVTNEIADKLGAKIVELPELLKEADFITVHAPLTEETKNLISAKEFAMMKSTAIIVNCARGGIINEADLITAIKDKKIAAAALDVFSKEPPLDSPLLDVEGIVLTPHLGASTEEAQVSVAVEVAECMTEALLKKSIRNVVNYVQMDPETYKFIEPYFGLAEKMGRFVSQLVKGGIKELKISYLGGISAYKVDVLSAALVTGAFSTQLEEDVNFINALEIAKARGVKIEHRKISDEKEYVNSIRIKVVTEKEEKILEGTLFANKEARFVKMDDIYIEVAPSKYMLVIENQDKPGVIGFLGTTLGKHNINIAGMSLGRRISGETALTILNLDNPLNEDVIKEIAANSNIVTLKFIKL